VKSFFSNIAHLGLIGFYTIGYISFGGISSLDYETNLTIFLVGFCLVCYVPYFISEKKAENDHYADISRRVAREKNKKRKKKKKKKKSK
jgi:hypothetical protein